MKTALLDVSFLIALLWPAHEHHLAAHRWFQRRARRARWATCPFTELAFVRIVSNPAFSPDALAPPEAVALLEQNLQHPRHQFWPDDLPLAQALIPPRDRLQGHRQVTDAYLLALASEHKGTLATFDAGIRQSAATAHLAALEIVPVR